MLSEESASSACPPLRTLPEDLVESGSIRVLRLLVRLMRDPVLQRSADALGVSAPTASRLLARARQWFKDPLFIYSAGRMHPTPRMLALSPRIEEELLRLESLFKPEEPFNPATVVRTLRIAAIDNAFHTLLMPFLETAATAAPGLSISVFDRAPTLLEDMRAGTLDWPFIQLKAAQSPQTSVKKRSSQAVTFCSCAADTRFTKNGLPAARLPKQIPERGPTSASSCRWRAAATV